MGAREEHLPGSRGDETQLAACSSKRVPKITIRTSWNFHFPILQELIGLFCIPDTQVISGELISVTSRKNYTFSSCPSQKMLHHRLLKTL